MPERINKQLDYFSNTRGDFFFTCIGRLQLDFYITFALKPLGQFGYNSHEQAEQTLEQEKHAMDE